MVEQSVSKESMIMNNIKFSKNEVIIIRLNMGSIPIYSTSFYYSLLTHTNAFR